MSNHPQRSRTNRDSLPAPEWRAISSFRGFGRAFRTRPHVGDTWRLGDGERMYLGRVIEVGAYYSTQFDSGWHVRFEFLSVIPEGDDDDQD